MWPTQGGTFIRRGSGQDIQIIVTPHRLGSDAYVLGIETIKAIIRNIPGILVVIQIQTIAS